MLYLAIAVCLVAAIFDFKTEHIPDKLTVPVMVFGVVYNFFSGNFSVLLSILAVTLLCYLAFYAGIALFSKEVIGGGDIKLVIALTSLMGFYVLPSLLTAVSISVVIIFLRGLLRGKWYTMFAPCMLLALLITKQGG